MKPGVSTGSSVATPSPEAGTAIPTLRDPPIEEVVCGLAFTPVAALDALEQGVYWGRVSDRFPKKQLQPALIEGFSLFQGVAPLRSWLISQEEDSLIQIQQDRFYMNWRRRGAAYPRFRDRGEAQGLCTRTLMEFDRFAEFVKERFAVVLEPTRVELQKQDLITRPKHWTDLSDLAEILPVVNTFADIRTSERVGLNLRMVESDELGITTIQIATRMDEEHRADAVRLDFHCSYPLEGTEPRAAFHAANARVNDMFKGLFSDDAWPRFGG